MNKAGGVARNMNSSLKLKPLNETYKLLLSDPSMHSLSPRHIAPSFHQKSHFKALTSVYMMQGHGAKIIDTEKQDADGTDARLLDKLVTAVGKNKAILNSSLSPPPQAFT